MAHRSGLYRSFSSSDLESTERIHDYVSDQEKGVGNRVPNLSRDVTRSSMVMPTLNNLGRSAARQRVYEAVININSLHDLEMERSINWFNFSRNLLPLRTLGDGNCLLHSASMYMWGVHDSKLTLRRLLEKRLQHENPNSGKLYARWKRQQEIEMRMLPLDVTLTYNEYSRDWNTVVSMASSDSLTGRPGPRYCPLESIHIFTLCNVLARTIVVLSDTVYRGHTMGTMQQCKMGGIYLPLLRHESECEKSPIVIGYGHGHFEPLISSEDLQIHICGNVVSEDAQHCIPLTRHSLEPLPVHFLTEQEDRKKQELLETYLELSSLPFSAEPYMTAKQGEKFVLCAMIKFRPPPAYTIQLMWNLFAEIDRMEESSSLSDAKEAIDSKPERVCFLHSSGCRNVGKSHLGGLCHVCYSKTLGDNESLTQALNSKYDLERTKATRSDPLPVTGGLGAGQHSSLPESAISRTSICKRSGCSNLGNNKLYGLCYNCYTKEVTGEFVSPMSDMHSVGEYVQLQPAVATGRGHVSLSSLDDAILPAAVGSMSLNNRHVPLTGESVMPLPFALSATMGHPIDTLQSAQAQTTYGTYTAAKTETLPGLVSSQDYRYTQLEEMPQIYPMENKNLCVFPGCPEARQTGSTQCSFHQEIKECNTEGCKNRVFSDEFGVCKSCLKEQQQVLNRREETKIPAKDKARQGLHPQTNKSIPSTFIAPSVYSGYPGPGPGFVSTATKIQGGTELGASSTPGTGYHSELGPICPVPSCGNPVQNIKHGLCNNCARAIEFEKNRRASNRCLTPLCDNEAVEQYNRLCAKCFSHVYNGETPLTPSSMQLPGGVHRPPYDDLPEGSLTNFLPGTNEWQLSPKPCIIESCNGSGVPAYAGLCRNCYESNLKLERTLASQKKEDNKAVKKVTEEIYTPCITVGCPRQGVQSQQMLCDVCYASRNGRGPVPQKAVGANAKCNAKDCIFFGNAEFGGYCSKCFVERIKMQEGTRGTLQRQMGSRGQASPRYLSPERGVHDNSQGLYAGDRILRPCRQPGCLMFGSPENKGYCSQCARADYVKDDYVFVGNKDLVRD